ICIGAALIVLEGFFSTHDDTDTVKQKGH
ncbi:lipoprotein signal peptidase, partial [Dickeya dadantii]|nr:lipoprotein signal peptidase [Dickeya dadantii]